MKILVTGCAGFIGFHLCKKLSSDNKHKIFGIDNLNNYYDIDLKINRLNILKKNTKNFIFKKIDLVDQVKLSSLFKKYKFDIVINLAAQAGVRYSINNPRTYLENNVIGFFNIIEVSRIFKIKHFIYASTSSVYGLNKNFPLEENHNTDKPISFYAATKKNNETIAYSYSHIYKLKTTGLRFFTVYGPYGRPDMALYKFTKNILKGKSIDLYNYGRMFRDFTYVDDVIDGICIVINNKINPKNVAQIYNIGSNNPTSLKKFVYHLEKHLKLKAKVNLKPLQKGDVIKTHASISKLKKFKPSTALSTGIINFINWYKDYYKY